MEIEDGLDDDGDTVGSRMDGVDDGDGEEGEYGRWIRGEGEDDG